MERCVKFRIYPNSAQQKLIQKTFGCCRFVYNYFLFIRESSYKERKETIRYVDCSAMLTQLKKELTWLKEVDSISLQEELRNLDFAYQKFFERVKRGGKSGYPKFKSKRNDRKSYKTKKNIRLSNNAIKLPKLGWVKCKVSKEVKV